MPLTRCFVGGEVVRNGELDAVNVVVRDGVIEAMISRGDDVSAGVDAARVDVVDCTGLLIAPGYIDVQCNGGAGHDITTDPSSILDVAEALPRFGVTAFLPTVVTAPAGRRRAAIDALDAQLTARTGTGGTGAVPIGLHFEGPMISTDHLGAHPPQHVAALDSVEVASWVDSERVRLVTLAPELPGAEALTAQLVAGGIAVSAGHTAMTPLDLAVARGAGLSYATHLFNAMAPFTHRSPGPIGAVLADDSIVAGIICDGVHVDPIAIRMAWNALGPHRTSLVSDASPALGMPYGRLRLAGFEIVHDETGVRTVDGVLAGSALALDQAVRNLIAFTGCDLCDAVATVTSTPADLLGLTDRGRVRVGARADFTILDHDANLVATVIAGTTAFTV